MVDEPGYPPPEGVRQGCRASLDEWTAFPVLAHIDRQVDPSNTPYEWLKQHLIAYADDLLFNWRLTKHTEFDQAIQQIWIIVDGVEGHDLQISMDKTVILFRIA